MRKKVYIGTSGFFYRHWFEKFYPPTIKKNELLSFYCQNFNTVEINSSFYQKLSSNTVKKWSENVGPEFVFSFKVSRFITHLKKLCVEKETIDEFFYPFTFLKQKKAVFLIQLPPSLKKDISLLSNFLKKLPPNYLYAIEFRHQSWDDKKVYQVLKQYKAAVVLSDSPIIKKNNQRLWPYLNVDTASFFYIRLHGSKKLFASSYSFEELKFYAQLINQKLKNEMSVFVYFNNDAQGFAVENAKTLKKLLKIK